MSSFSSNATYSTWQPSAEDYARWSREEKERITTSTEELSAALAFTELKDKYQIWRDYFWSGEYEDYGPELEFPEFLDDYEYFVERNLQIVIVDSLDGSKT